MSHDLYDDASAHSEWWLASLGDTLIWARLRILPAGTAEVLDADGATLPYDSPDTARAALMDAEFVALDGLDEDDAAARGFSLQDITPPEGEDSQLRTHMVVRLGKR